MKILNIQRRDIEKDNVNIVGVPLALRITHITFAEGINYER